MTGSTWANHDHDLLLEMAGTDPHSIVLLSALFDNAEHEDQVDVESLRDWCVETTDRTVGDSLNLLLVLFPDRIRGWRDESDEAESQRLWHDMLADLFRLRTGLVPCSMCVDVKWNVSQQIGAAVNGPYCAACLQAIASIPRGRTQLRVVA